MQLTPTEVAAIREELGLTRKALSLKLGMQEDAVRAWESGKRACKGASAVGLRALYEARDSARRTAKILGVE